MTVLKFAPDRPYLAYQLRGSFSIDADAPPDAVRRVGYDCGRKFIADLERQGYAYDGNGIHFDPRPRPHVEPMELPPTYVQDQHEPNDYIQTPETHRGRVDYKFWGTFIRREIPIDSRP